MFSGSVLQPIIVFLAILLAWQAKSYLVILQRLLLAVPVTTVLIATNAPLALLRMWIFGSLSQPGTSYLVYWNDFLQTGGPLVMA